jgi:hypothetical protein
MTYDQIGQEFGVTGSGAALMVKRHRESIPIDAVEDVKEQLLELLDFYARELRRVVGRKHYVATVKGDLVTGPDGEFLTDDGVVVNAVQVGLKVASEVGRIVGAHAPTKKVIDYYPHDAFLEDVAALERQIAEKEAALAADPAE